MMTIPERTTTEPKLQIIVSGTMATIRYISLPTLSILARRVMEDIQLKGMPL